MSEWENDMDDWDGFTREFLKTRLAVLLSSVLAVSVCAAQTPADSSPTAQSDQLAEIIVTAQKRTQDLQDVPIAVSVLSGDTLKKIHLDNAGDLSGLIPNLHVQDSLGAETPIFALRGVSMSDFSLNQPSPVATYYDEVYEGNFALLGVSLYDLERIEVLPGPQGTLYGKNTTGGAINVVARKPDFDTEGYLTAGYGNYDRREFAGAFQTGLTDTLAGRVAFTYLDQDGWFENLTAGHPDLNATNEFGVRGSLLFKPRDDLQFVLRLSTSNQDPPNYGVYAQPFTNLGCIGAGVYTAYNAQNPIANPYLDDCRTGLGKRQLRSQYTQDRENRTYSVALTATWNLREDLMLTSISSWDKASMLVPEDTDGSDLAVIDEPYKDRVHQVAQDLRLSSDFKGPFNFIAGAYYNHEDVFNSTSFHFYNLLNVPLNGVYYGNTSPESCQAGIALGFLDCQVTNSFDQEKESKAFYTDMTLAVSQRITLHGGLRYSFDRGEQTNFASNIYSAGGALEQNLIPGPQPVTGLSAGCSVNGTTAGCSYSEREPTGKFGVDYKTDAGTLLYASASRGYRASGFNAQAFFQPSELTVAKPETVNAFEAGSKMQLFENRLQLNSALFFYQYFNQQVLSTNPTTAAQTLENLSKSRIAGAELSLLARPVRTLTLTGGIGLLTTRVEEGSVSGISVVGAQLDSAPKASVSAAADWSFYSNSFATAAIRIDGTYSTRQYFDPYDQYYQSSYGLLNLSLSLRSADDKWGVAFWGKNLFDKFYLTNEIGVPGFGFIYSHEGTPMMYGVRFDYHWGR
jgi:iron complex outermembrane receptor protein